ncbi:hypothetical protein Y694_04565 [Methylibium sp. T29-B]|nr:hypothetical protein Y694_04565 [Methylibium sp. T29-B]
MSMPRALAVMSVARRGPSGCMVPPISSGAAPSTLPEIFTVAGCGLSQASADTSPPMSVSLAE